MKSAIALGLFILLLNSTVFAIGHCPDDLNAVDGTIGQKKSGMFSKKVRGYAALGAGIVGASLVTAHLSTLLGEHYKEGAQILTFLTFTGISALRAPIDEYFYPRWRQKFFTTTDAVQSKSPREEYLFQQWRREQVILSSNGQIARGVTSQFLILIEQNFERARLALRAGDENFAASQIALALYKRRMGYEAVAADEPLVLAAIWISLSDQLVVGNDSASRMFHLVLEKLKEVEPDGNTPEVQTYYEELLKIWFSRFLEKT